MKYRTKCFLMDGVLAVSIVMIIGSLWLAAISDASTGAKCLFFLISVPLVAYLARMLYVHVIKDGRYKLVRGVYCELEAFFQLEQEKPEFFKEVMAAIAKLGDVTFTTKKPYDEAKYALSRLTKKPYPLIPISRLMGKRVEVLVSKKPLHEFDAWGISCEHFVQVKDKTPYRR